MTFQKKQQRRRPDTTRTLAAKIDADTATDAGTRPTNQERANSRKGDKSSGNNTPKEW